MRKYLIHLFLCILVFSGMTFSFYSCTEPPPEKLTRAQKNQVDTLFSRLVADLRIETDSLCEVMMETQLQRATDSLVLVRKAEEKKIRQRLSKKVNQ